MDLDGQCTAKRTDPNAYARKSNASPLWLKKDEDLIRIETSLTGQASVSIQSMRVLDKTAVVAIDQFML
jgi:hypothetical protein